MLYFSRPQAVAIVCACIFCILSVTPNFISAPDTEIGEVINKHKIRYGLDLQGGAHIAYEADTKEYFDKKFITLKSDVHRLLRPRAGNGGGFPIAYRNLKINENGVTVKIIGGEDAVIEAQDRLKILEQPINEGLSFNAARGKNSYDLKREGENLLTLTLTETARTFRTDRALAQTVEVLRRRIDAFGTREASIFRSGENRIVVQVPGVKDVGKLKDEIGKTAQMSFHMASEELTAQPGARIPPGKISVPSAEEPGLNYLLEESPLLSGDNLVNANVTPDEYGKPSVGFTFDAAGADKFGRVTRENIGRIFAIVLDNEVISAPRIQSAITGGKGVITGSFTPEEATNLSLLLRAGALPVDLSVAEERTVGPELGKESVEAGKRAVGAGFLAVSLFMIAYYGLPGVFSVIGLIVNVFAVFGALTLLGATLTLPGVAGAVLGIGVAVDANVLINERIKEELRSGEKVLKAAATGYERAWSAILDSHITGLVSALIMFALGSGPIRGFAVTLALGVITSLFSSVWVTRLLFATHIHKNKPKTLRFGLSGA